MDTPIKLIKSKCCANCANLIYKNISSRKVEVTCLQGVFPTRSSGYADADYSTLQNMCEEFFNYSTK